MRICACLNPAVVGALHVTCADESEWECIDSFQRCFVNEMLPDLKFGQKTAFHLSNLGGRYEWGAIPVAEHHFATAESHHAFKVMLIRVSAHVATEGNGRAARFGRMRRYDTQSTACGALHALLAGGDKPFLHDLREAFESEGRDRLAMLLDESRVAPTCRGLFVAVVNARLQARRAELEIDRHEPASPTLYLIASCVTLNRPEQDTELLCGLGTIDHRSPAKTIEYLGLGDDPTRYVLHDDPERVRVSDDQLPA